MINGIQHFVIILLILFGTVMTILYWIEVTDKERYMRDKEIALTQKAQELTFRENSVVDKEICMKEVSRLKEVQTNIMKMIGASEYPLTVTVTSEEAKK